MKIFCTLALMSALSCQVWAQEKSSVTDVRMSGPFDVASPFVIDSTSIDQKKYDATESALNTPIHCSVTTSAPVVNLNNKELPKGQLCMIAFDIMATRSTDLALQMTGTNKTITYVDEQETTLPTRVVPGFHTVTVKFVTDSAHVDVELTSADVKTIAPGSKRSFTMADNLQRRTIYSASVSPSGRWVIATTMAYDKQNKRTYESTLTEVASRRTTILSSHFCQWMPKSDRLFFTDEENGATVLKTIDPATGVQSTWLTNVPDGDYSMSPNEDYAIVSISADGPKKEKGVFLITHPDDRQPNWRSRESLVRIDLKNGMVQPITQSWHQISLEDISPSGRYILFSVSDNSNLTERPTTRFDYYRLDISTMKAEKIVEQDGFINHDIFGTTDDQVLFVGSPECLGGVGNRVPEGMTPSMYDLQLYAMDVPSRKVTPLTADFDPSVQRVVASVSDGMIYFTAENADSVSLYALNPQNNKIVRIAQPLENVTGLSVANAAKTVVCYGNSMSVPDQLYVIDTKKNRTQKILDPDAERFANIALGETKNWSFTCKRGYKVTGFYSLPANYDPAKKYPLIVHYYGGCAPSSRRFGGGGHYPVHLWNAMGYVVLTLNPSGASGFGQEWAARHVNTMGEGVAQDIIEATEQFVRDVPQIDGKHIGCVSASYGGFMTQYMLTKTDLFACGISHAGISSHTSYWGEGYWGYSYSEVSAANSFPWNRKDLYVDRSPLYNADKIHTPLLFTHGTADTNVPIGESIQMFTALRLLGTPTAFVQVEGENHGIMDPEKRTLWIYSMIAWFDKWLKEDSSWWDAMYPEKKM